MAGQDGGGIFHSGGVLIVSNSHFAHNVAGRNGGGLYVNGGTASIVDSIFSGNKAAKKTGLGTAIYVGLLGTLDLEDTVISQNGVPIFRET